MGGGTWNVGTYRATTNNRRAAGTPDFDYSARVTSGAAPAVVHPLLDPRAVAGTASPFAGKVMREVVVTPEHPNPTAIAVVLDVTGSNISAAKVAHSKLPLLLGVLQRKAYVDDPQINFMAIGDAYSDDFPLQVGQFESDNRLDEQLNALILEGNGGAQRHETYELAAYYLARHTHQEPLERHGKKGFAFFIGDEMPYETLSRNFTTGHYAASHTLESLTGDRLESDIPTAQIFEELQAKYEVFFLFQKQGNYRKDEILPAWREYLGERALVLEDPNAVCEVIAGILAMLGGGLEAEEAIADLSALGTDASALKAVGKTLATVQGNSPAVRTEGSLPDLHDGDGPTGSTRL